LIDLSVQNFEVNNVKWVEVKQKSMFPPLV
jgi:hypothetical protein